jgi:two-component system CheB/CheR fusion protein
MKCTTVHGDDTDGNPRVIGSMIDIDDQVAAEAALQAAAQRKDEFLAMLGHELRNPLVPVRNAAEVLRGLASNDDRLAWIHDVLVRQVGHITRLVEDLLDISRIARGTLQMRLEPIDLGHVLRRAIDAAQPALARKRHRFEADLPQDSIWVEADAIRLIQVFENLLSNAAKYTDDGGQIRMSLAAEESWAVVRVRDNGIGVPPAMQARIFDLFVQDQRTTDRSHGGLGVGLTLARRLVDLHGGSIMVRSDGSGTGSEFVVRLPLLAAGRPESPAGEPIAVPAGSGRVLVVDDDRDGAETLAVVLQMYGYEARVAGNLDQALAEARRFRPAVVLMDIALPDADGFEVMRRLRALPELDAGLVGITMSGFGAIGDIERSRAEGFARHLVKPVEPGDLDTLLRGVLAPRP